MIRLFPIEEAIRSLRTQYRICETDQFTLQTGFVSSIEDFVRGLKDEAEREVRANQHHLD
jgi:hypothetical protein